MSVELESVELESVGLGSRTRESGSNAGSESGLSTSGLKNEFAPRVRQRDQAFGFHMPNDSCAGGGGGALC